MSVRACVRPYVRVCACVCVEGGLCRIASHFLRVAKKGQDERGHSYSYNSGGVEESVLDLSFTQRSYRKNFYGAERFYRKKEKKKKWSDRLRIELQRERERERRGGGGGGG